MRIFVQMTACLCLLALAACDDSSDAKSGSDKVISTEGLVDASTESVEMNIIFKYPDGKEAKLGQTLGLNSCKKLALQHVVDKSLIMSTGWSYTCCTIEEGSQCHRQLQ